MRSRNAQTYRSLALATALGGPIVAAGCAQGAQTGGSADAGGCVPGASVACECSGGGIGAQVCPVDGLGWAPCVCSPGGMGQATGNLMQSASDGGSSGDNTAGLDDTAAGLCGDDALDPGECDPADPAYCPADCPEATGTATDNCADAPTYFGAVAGVASRWESGGFVGFSAGNSMCQAMGADHVCDYEELRLAQMKGELAAIPAGTTAWLHRTTVANTALGVPSNPGSGGRCADWTYAANVLSDGEYVQFAAMGAAEYVIDGDTFYDGVATRSAQTDLLQCGNELRSLLCCQPACR